MYWKKYVTETIQVYRGEFKRLNPEIKEAILKEFFDDTLLEPCQSEVLVSPGEVGILVVHDKDLDDMRIEIREGSKTYKDSEFIKKYTFEELLKRGVGKTLLSKKYIVFWTRNDFFPEFGRPRPEEVARFMLFATSSFASERIKKKQVDTIRQSTGELKESIARLPESGIRSELTEHARMIDKALGEIKRIDKDIGGVRRLMGVSKEYQDWRLLISDVEDLKKRSHVSKELFDSEVKRLDQRIDSLKEIKFWSKRTVVDIILAVIATASTIIAALLAAGIIHV